MLLALALAGRSCKLNALDLRCMSDHGDAVTCTLSKLTKSRGYG